jgi:membrane protease YdiL (CAAX protease family)
MSASTPILALVIYLVLYLLPLNPVRFRWGVHRGLTPMPPEIEEKAKHLDWVANLSVKLTLIATIIVLARTSSLSLHAVGVSASNWRKALLFGLLFSAIDVVLIAFLQGASRPSKNPNPYPEVSSANRYGLQLLTAFSSEFWRAFSIVALLRSEFSAWAAVGITSIVWAVPFWYQSAWTCAGAVAGGLVLGFIFVKTGSLLAPLTASLIAAAYTVFLETRKTRVLPCPACGHNVPGALTPGARWIVCPSCQSRLTLTIPLWMANTGAAIGAIATIVYLIYVRNFDPVGAALLLLPAFFAWMFLSALVLWVLFPHAAKVEIAPVNRSIFHF